MCRVECLTAIESAALAAVSRVAHKPMVREKRRAPDKGVVIWSRLHGDMQQSLRLGSGLRPEFKIDVSCDAYLGVPFNVAQYALFAHMVAHQLGCQAKSFTWVGADVHVYANHVDQVREQLTKEVKPPPRLGFIGRLPSSICDYTLANFQVTGYAHSDYVPAEVSLQGKPGWGIELHY